MEGSQNKQIIKDNKGKVGIYRWTNLLLVFLYLAMGSFTDMSCFISQEPSILFAIVPIIYEKGRYIFVYKKID
jgi:hypothetical protein